MPNDTNKLATGWLRDYPDIRDFTIGRADPPRYLKRLNEPSIKDMLFDGVGIPEKGTKATTSKLPSNVDLREWCSPIEDQGQIGSCTAHAGIALLEYFERRSFGKHIDASRLFLYKTTRKLLGFEGDTGAYLRTTMGAMRLFGVPPEEYWPYNTDEFDDEPSAFCYSFAQNYQAIQYYRLDTAANDGGNRILTRVKELLSAGIPAMFGFTCYDSLYDAANDGVIPFPSGNERVVGGHAVAAIGYDDNQKYPNNDTNKTEKGAILIRNSWGKNWGDKGYGWLPYEYIVEGLAVDWWTLIKSEWVETGEFKF